MDVRQEVKKKENYGSIVAYFKDLKTPDMDQLVLLIDTIAEMSEEIFEHYKALSDLLREELKKMQCIAGEKGNYDFLSDSEKSQLAYIIEQAFRLKILLPEKYEDLAKASERV